ncbi:MAG: sulfatase [Planctomycetota bacterium]
MPHLTRAALCVLLLYLAACVSRPTTPNTARPQHATPPNIVIIFTDDQGYGDLSCFGHPTIHTPHLDALAADGMKLTQCYVPSPVCSPSRAALLTGCYPKRVGMHQHVIFPQNNYGLHTEEVTLADMLNAHGYATGMFGKWHLGHRPGLMPTDQGFDTFFGIPYSNDMAQIHLPEDNNYPFRMPLIRNNEVIAWEPDQRLLTRRYTEEAVAFIEQHKDRPFFVYLPHSMPHIPLYASDDFEGESPRGLYGDVIEEIDWSVGQIVAALEAHGLTDNTLVIFTSDNGPWLQYNLEGGSAGLLRGGKGSNWEGGQRVPALVAMPGTIPAGSVCREVVTTMDLLPTIATLTGATLSDRVIDGHDITPLLTGEDGATSPTDAFLYYTSGGDLAGIRQGPWKLLLQSDELYHLDHDPGEQYNLANQNADRIAELRALATQMDAEITEHARPTRVVEELLFDPRKPE